MQTAGNSANVFVVIPNQNGINHLSYSLPSLAKSTYLNYQILLVDDLSTDDSLNFVGMHYPGVKVLTNDRARGFAGAVNTGIAYALAHGADYIAIYNNDIKVMPRWMEIALDIFHKQSNAGLVGYTEIRREKEILFYNSKNLIDKIEYKNVIALPGCLYLCPARVFRHIGLFDEEYFMYGEDNDYFHRLMEAGYLIIQTNAPVWHYGEGSSGSLEMQRLITICIYRNLLRFAVKNCDFYQIILTLAKITGYALLPRWFWRNKLDNGSVNRLVRFNFGFRCKCLINSVLFNMVNVQATKRAKLKEQEWIRGHSDALASHRTAEGCRL